jgi:hypothetical protein
MAATIDGLTIKTNNQRRALLSGWELTTKERKELDYIEESELGDSCARFFRYKGSIYDLHEFQRIVQPGTIGGPWAYYDHKGNLSGWDGIQTDSFFSGILVKYLDDDSIRVGLCYC